MWPNATLVGWADRPCGNSNVAVGTSDLNPDRPDFRGETALELAASRVMKLMESTKDEGNESATTTDDEWSDQGGRNGFLDGYRLSSYGQARRYISPSN